MTVIKTDNVTVVCIVMASDVVMTSIFKLHISIYLNGKTNETEGWVELQIVLTLLQQHNWNHEMILNNNS